jgi:hypothetical protein
MKNGTFYGIHAESSSQAMPLVRKYQAAGVQIAALLAHENPGLCVDAKAINSNILTIARWHNPNPEFEGGGGSEPWPPAKQQEFATKAIQLIFDRTNDTEYAGADYFCPGLNEWDKPGVAGWRNMAESWVLLCQEASRRSPEMKAKGLHPIRLAIPGFNNGTPEWAEMVAVKETGLFELMKARGDILIVHEGVWWDEPIDQGFGDRIPGAPSVPANAGSKCGRFNYWYGLLGVEVPFVVTEWYDGLKRSHDPALRLERMKWYDRLVRRNPWCRGFLPFELTDIVDGPWWLVDFTPTFQSAAMLADMVAERDKPNPPAPIGEDKLSDLQKATLKEVAASLRTAADKLDAVTAPPKHTMRGLTNQQVINSFAHAFGKLPTNAPLYIAAIARAGLNGILPSGTGRLALYTGAAVEEMVGLTAAERAALIAALA